MRNDDHDDDDDDNDDDDDDDDIIIIIIIIIRQIYSYRTQSFFDETKAGHSVSRVDKLPAIVVCNHYSTRMPNMLHRNSQNL